VFGRATITLGIGPHSSYNNIEDVFNVEEPGCI